MAARFDAFVLLAGMRTGSNFLEANLNALPGLTGFRFFHDHDLRVLDRVLPDPRVAKIILTRNPLDSYVSWKIAQATGQWKLTNPAALRSARATFDAAEFDTWVQAQQAFRQQVRHELQVTGQTAFHIGYDEVSDVAVLNGLARFLGVPAVLGAPDPTLKRQNPEPLRQKVTNSAEMEAALLRMDPFGLDQTQETEPRRLAAVPGYVLANGAPLLFLPVAGGPEADVTAWLATLGSGGVRTGLTHRDLRQWKRAHPGHRSFAVLRHPLLRAHSVFCTRVLSGGLPEVRMRLIRTQGLDLPLPGEARTLTPQAHRAAFLAFLRLVKQGLAGQAGLRVDPGWASQTAVLQGHATLRPPDLLLHEDRLAEGLARLAQDMGLAAPAYRAAPPPPPVIDEEVEQAAREAYARDYLEFGFGPWRGGQAA